jgi:hypothetical protein
MATETYPQGCYILETPQEELAECGQVDLQEHPKQSHVVARNDAREKGSVREIVVKP